MRQRTVVSIIVAVAAAFVPVALWAEDDHGIVNARVPEAGVLFAGQPTPEQLQALADAGYRTVIDLRGAEEDRGYEEASVAGRAGLEYVSIPVTRETLAAPETFEEFIRRFRDADRPVLVHCASGNRVGALYYAYLVAAEGRPRDAALDEAKKNGLRSDSLAASVDTYLDQRD